MSEAVISPSFGSYQPGVVQRNQKWLDISGIQKRINQYLEQRFHNAHLAITTGKAFGTIGGKAIIGASAGNMVGGPIGIALGSLAGAGVGINQYRRRVTDDLSTAEQLAEQGYKFSEKQITRMRERYEKHAYGKKEPTYELRRLMQKPLPNSLDKDRPQWTRASLVSERTTAVRHAPRAVAEPNKPGENFGQTAIDFPRQSEPEPTTETARLAAVREAEKARSREINYGPDDGIYLC
jgi:hypothetical protein